MIKVFILFTKTHHIISSGCWYQYVRPAVAHIFRQSHRKRLITEINRILKLSSSVKDIHIV